MAPSDEELADRAASGDSAAFEDLVRRHTRGVFALCHRFLCDEGEAEDRVQEAFLKAYQNIGKYRSGYRFSSWLFKIAQNLCIDTLRARKAWAPLPLQQPSDDVAEPLGYDEVEALDGAVQQLDARARAVLHYKYALGWTATDIAAALDMSPGNVRVILHRAIRSLRTKLRQP